MNADPNYVARAHIRCIERLKGLVNDDRVAMYSRRGRREHVEPTWCDDGRAKRDVARVNKVNGHASSPLSPVTF
jgi:hypothetical protein